MVAAVIRGAIVAVVLTFLLASSGSAPPAVAIDRGSRLDLAASMHDATSPGGRVGTLGSLSVSFRVLLRADRTARVVDTWRSHG